MELAPSLRRARRAQANFTAPSTPSTTDLPLSEGRTNDEFKFSAVDESGQLRPLKLPPRLSPCSTPPRAPRSRRTTAPAATRRSCSLLPAFGSSKSKDDFDPFAAAVESIRKDDGPPHDRRITENSLGTPGKEHHRRAKGGLFAFLGSKSRRKRVFEGDESGRSAGWMQNGNYSFNSKLEIVKENRSAPSAVDKQRLLACLGFKK